LSHAADLIARHRGKEAMSFLATSHRVVPKSIQAERFDLLGQAAQQTGNFRDAHRYLKRAYRLARWGADSWRMAYVSLRLGDVSRQIEMFHDAIRWYRVAEQLSVKLKRNRIRLDAMSGRAMALRGLGKYADALKTFSWLLASYRKEQDAEGMAYVLWAMGTTERFAGNFSKARQFLEEAVRRYKKIDDKSGLAYARCGLGGTFRMMGLADKSRRLYAEAFRIFRREKDEFGMCYSSCGQGNGWRMKNQFNRALPFMQRAERGYRKLKLFGPLGFVLWSRAQLRISQKNFRLAEADLKESEVAFRKSKDPRGLVYVELGKGDLARARNFSSRSFYQRVARSARRLGLSFELTHARVRLNLAKPSAYSANGVAIRDFLQYRSFP
jgi:tetratricopeptide (TPR) repeat protein